MRGAGNREAGGLISIKQCGVPSSVDAPPLISGEGISGANLRTRGSIGCSWGDSSCELWSICERLVRWLSTSGDGFDRSFFFFTSG